MHTYATVYLLYKNVTCSYVRIRKRCACYIVFLSLTFLLCIGKIRMQFGQKPERFSITFILMIISYAFFIKIIKPTCSLYIATARTDIRSYG